MRCREASRFESGETDDAVSELARFTAAHTLTVKALAREETSQREAQAWVLATVDHPVSASGRPAASKPANEGSIPSTGAFS